MTATSPTHGASDSADSVMLIQAIGLDSMRPLLAAFGLKLQPVPLDQPIPGSFWGDSEAGLQGDHLLVRLDTPVHSALHEAGHYVCMPPSRRAALDTDAGGDYDEENAVCYWQIMICDRLTGMDRQRMCRDMDTWGYTFRLGSAAAWFREDAEDARAWLIAADLLDPSEESLKNAVRTSD